MRERMEKIYNNSEQEIKEEIPEEKYFENYQIKESDLETLQRGLDTLVESGLVDEKVLNEVWVTTYDSRDVYIFTRGQRPSGGEEISSSSRAGFRIYKIPHSGFTGKAVEYYRGAKAGSIFNKIDKEIETIGADSKRFPVISIPPVEPFNRIHRGRYNYLTDIIFHEAGHIELDNWQKAQESIADFPSPEQKEKFLSVIRQTKIFPSWITDLLIKNITPRVIREMYAMLIDREATKRYDPERVERENKELQEKIAQIRDKSKDQEVVARLEEWLKSEHITGRLLAIILEEQFPDFIERKRFVRSVLQRT